MGRRTAPPCVMGRLRPGEPVGAGVAACAIARALGLRARHGAREVAATIAPAWRPGEAHLTGKPAEKDAGAAAPEKDEHLDRLEREVEERRGRRE